MVPVMMTNEGRGPRVRRASGKNALGAGKEGGGGRSGPLREPGYQSLPSGNPSLGVTARARVVVLVLEDTVRTLPSIITTIMPPALRACRRVGSHTLRVGVCW